MRELVDDRRRLPVDDDVAAELFAEVERRLLVDDKRLGLTVRVRLAQRIVLGLALIRDRLPQPSLEVAKALHQPDLLHAVLWVPLGDVEVAVEGADRVSR